MNEAEFDREISFAEDRATALSLFGSLLAKESGLNERLVVVGGSAIQIYTEGWYVSEDVDLVGDRTRIIPVLRRWGFVEREGRARRVYWFKESIGYVDLVGTEDRSGLPTQVVDSPSGPLRLAPVEALVIRRLVLHSRTGSEAYFEQAERLARLFPHSIDWEYVEVNAKYEKVLPVYRRLRNVLG